MPSLQEKCERVPTTVPVQMYRRARRGTQRMGWVKPSALLLALYGAYVSSSVNSYQLPKSPS